MRHRSVLTSPATQPYGAAYRGFAVSQIAESHRIEIHRLGANALLPSEP
jgi:hypothetical protein